MASRGSRHVQPTVAQERSRRAGPAEATDLLPILVTHRVLTAEQAERVRRAARVGSLGIEQAIKQLGFANEVQIAQALAAHAGLPYVKINPSTSTSTSSPRRCPAPSRASTAWSRSPRPRARSRSPCTTPSRPSRRRHQAGDRARRRAGGGDAQRRRDGQQGFYDLQTSLQTAEKQLTASRVGSVDLSNQEFLSAETTELDPAAAPVVKALDHILGYAFEQRPRTSTSSPSAS